MDRKCAVAFTGRARYLFIFQEATMFGLAASWTADVTARKKYVSAALAQMKLIRDDPSAPAALRDRARTDIATEVAHGYRAP
jgi:hypothetical protein